MYIYPCELAWNEECIDVAMADRTRSAKEMT
jgi:hypothetical protein